MVNKKRPSLRMLAKRTQPRRLFWDCETSPNVVYSWRVGYKIAINFENIVEERALVCIGYKWQGGPVQCLTWHKGDDKAMLQQFVPILESADEVVAHYGDKFDLPWVRARAAFHGIPVSPYIKTIDTKAQAARNFYFNSNRLDYLGQFLGLGKKIETDFQLWKDVVAGDEAALARMVRYCKQDVKLLERVYLRMESYNKPKTHQGVVRGGLCADCPGCGSADTIRIGQQVSGLGVRKPTMQCKSCGRKFTVSRRELERKHEQCVKL